MPDGSSTAHLFRPKLISVIAEGYDTAAFRKDAVAALTVAIVALPLSMAIAIASGVSPERGLYTAIIGGALVSALGGSRYQIGGPAGAFIVLVAATVAKLGLSGLLLTVLMSGAMLTVLGALGAGTLVRFIPEPVTVGFTSGIAVTIFAGQVKDLLGLRLHGVEPAAFFPKLETLAQSFGSITPAAALLGILCATLIFALRRYRPAWPRKLIAVVLASACVALLHLPVATIGSRFGGIPHGLPWPAFPAFAWPDVLAVLPSALAFTLLGGIESLLSAKVADGMTARRHRSNMELVAQGIANIASALFGGIAVTGTIARTATNIRAGARSPFSGMMHSGFILLFMLIAAPLASFVPLCALAAVLVVVCWNMADATEFGHLLRHRRTALVLLATFTGTLAIDLIAGIAAGCAAAGAIHLWDRRREP
jgi:SulP family sulfate permease